MVNFKGIRKILSFVSCAAISIGVTAGYAGFSGQNGDITADAKTIAEIQEQRKANEEKIAALETEITALEGNKNEEAAYQNTLREQISIIQENIDLLNTELEALDKDITLTETNISNLDTDIENQQTQIDENIELFKERLRYMYVTGNDNAATVILGSSSFYDVMSRVQMMNRIAEYDDKLINDILDEIDSLETSKQELETEKLSLEMKQEDQKRRKEEKAAEIDSLNVKMQSTQEEIDRIALEQKMLNQDKETLEADNAALDAEQAEIEAEIARKAAEAQRLWEEQQAAIAAQQAEAARLAAEQAAAQQAAQNQSSGETSYTEPYVDPTPAYVPQTVATAGFAWPAPGFSYISSYFGARWGTQHRGIDIGDAGISGGYAVASQAGTVVTANNTCTHNYAKTSSCGCGGGYGNYVVISHDGTYSTLYGHLASVSVSVGDYVSQGQVIGVIGSTGWSTGAHLHFEVRVNGVQQDPMGYVSR